MWKYLKLVRAVNGMSTIFIDKYSCTVSRSSELGMERVAGDNVGWFVLRGLVTARRRSPPRGPRPQDACHVGASSKRSTFTRSLARPPTACKLQFPHPQPDASAFASSHLTVSSTTPDHCHSLASPLALLCSSFSSECWLYQSFLHSWGAGVLRHYAAWDFATCQGFAFRYLCLRLGPQFHSCSVLVSHKTLTLLLYCCGRMTFWYRFYLVMLLGSVGVDCVALDLIWIVSGSLSWWWWVCFLIIYSRFEWWG